MGRSRKQKLKKSQRIPESCDAILSDETTVPIKNLPDNFLLMKVNSGTKMRNVLEYASKHFSGVLVWNGIGHGIPKTISCAEIFKRKFTGLHQITKLRYVKSKKVETKSSDEDTSKISMVPEIHILLSKDIPDTEELGYQAPGATFMFQDRRKPEESAKEREKGGFAKNRMPEETAEEFAAMGLRIGQKRPRQRNQDIAATKKSKIKKADELPVDSDSE